MWAGRHAIACGAGSGAYLLVAQGLIFILRLGSGADGAGCRLSSVLRPSPHLVQPTPTSVFLPLSSPFAPPPTSALRPCPHLIHPPISHLIDGWHLLLSPHRLCECVYRCGSDGPSGCPSKVCAYGVVCVRVGEIEEGDGRVGTEWARV